MSRTVRLTRLTAEEAAILLSGASKRAISGHDVAAIVQEAGLLSPDGTLNLVQVAAYLAREVAGRDD